MTLPIVLPLPRVSISFATGPVCFLAQSGSASIASGLRVGAFPSNVMIPVIVEAAAATPGQKETAINEAARNNLLPVTHMLGSFVIAQIVASVVTDDAALRRVSESADSTSG